MSGVKVKDKDVEGHSGGNMKKHLTMKYDLKAAREFNAFEDWVNESIEDLFQDGDAPTVEPTEFCDLSEEKIRKKLKNILAKASERDRTSFIDLFVKKISSLPPGLLEHMRDQGA